MLSDKSILITGGTGSFGRAFVRTVLTRFNNSLGDVPEIVLCSIVSAWDGEVQLPKMPLSRITDIAKAIGPDCRQEIVRIRPGEETHEDGNDSQRQFRHLGSGVLMGDRVVGPDLPSGPRLRAPRAGLRPARPPLGTRKLGAALRFLERRYKVRIRLHQRRPIRLDDRRATVFLAQGDCGVATATRPRGVSHFFEPKFRRIPPRRSAHPARPGVAPVCLPRRAAARHSARRWRTHTRPGFMTASHRRITLISQAETNGRIRTFGLIPARGGSKGISRRNIRPIAGKPLIAWPIEAAPGSPPLDAVVVSADDSEIAEVARRAGAEIPFMRPAKLAQDHTPGIDSVLHALTELPDFGAVLLLQPTSPLRGTEDIDNRLRLAWAGEASLVVSVSEPDTHPFLTYRLAADKTLAALVEAPSLSRRQDVPAVFAFNGAPFCALANWLMRGRRLVAPKTLEFVMPHTRSVDVDTTLDWKFAELLLMESK